MDEAQRRLVRRRRMLGDLDLATTAGFEIGALHRPLVRRNEGSVRYVDYASTEALRRNFRYEDDPADIVDVDIIWGQTPLPECVGETVDYILASHVIEHVPDLIGWLQELHGTLKPAGVVGLAIPDRRATFDIRRPVSLPSEMVEAYLLQRRQPSLRQVFESAAMSRDMPGEDTWRPGESLAGLPSEMLGRLVPALELVERLAKSPGYVDAHCWVFTPASFLDVAEALAQMGFFQFIVGGLFPAEEGHEFLLRLHSVADAKDPNIAASIATCRSSLIGSAAAPEAEKLSRQMEQLQANCDALQRSLDQIFADLQEREIALAAAQDETARLRGSIDEMKQSHSWRVTAPLRGIARLMQRA